MQQQINLFRQVSLPIKSPLDTKIILLIYGGFAGILMLIFLINSFLLSHEGTQLIEANSRLETARLTFIEIAAKYPRTDIPSQLIDSSRLPLCNVKFSNYLQAFAQAIVPGLWLTEINISDNGKQISLQGHALKPIMVQLYLQQLKQIALFTPMTFSIVDLSEAKSALNFQMTARTADAHIQ